ncbi:PIG-L deacetylase family protein [Neobacillus drentensis]|uniref:PIG-L deacetylase family protein n=1 Tax=Neobacillus drentensis TaxID=220684 RepID=UPI002866A27F|nr:PIG-L family deacetylase [Neobacillus drentensis]MDR7239972.1 LmbE family N-acetylglucosaminyl deacetylase [Neobacillus drentensis]
MIELYRGLYRYPGKMIGRKFDLLKIKKNTDVLVIAAHPDDDVIGLSTTLFRHRLLGDNIVVAFVTNGSCWQDESWRIKESETERRAKIRYNEASNALSLLGIPKDNIICLGFPDGGTHRYLRYLAKDIQLLIQKLNPNRVYAHCIEGGHSDHDMTSYVVKTICNKMGFSNLFEWTEYNPKQPLGTENVKFLPSQKHVLKESIIKISEEERTLKKKMLAFHESQDVEKYFGHGEALRPAAFSEIEMELNKFCQLPKRRLIPVVKSFNKSI